MVNQADHQDILPWNWLGANPRPNQWVITSTTNEPTQLQAMSHRIFEQWAITSSTNEPAQLQLWAITSSNNEPAQLQAVSCHIFNKWSSPAPTNESSHLRLMSQPSSNQWVITSSNNEPAQLQAMSHHISKQWACPASSNESSHLKPISQPSSMQWVITEPPQLQPMSFHLSNWRCGQVNIIEVNYWAPCTRGTWWCGAWAPWPASWPWPSFCPCRGTRAAGAGHRPAPTGCPPDDFIKQKLK